MSATHPWHRRCDGAIEASWLGALLLAPVAMAPHHSEPFVHAPAAVTTAFAVLGVGAWAVKGLSGGVLARSLPPAGAAAGGIRRWLLGLALGGGSLVLGSALSLAPRLAWLGAHPRALGAVTQLSVLALAALVLGHLRSRDQVVRVLEVTALASLPICLYALLQAFGADPLFPPPAGGRPFSLLGNANILGHYLLPALLLTLGLLLETASTARRDGFRSGARQGLLVGLLGLQGWTLLAAGSRGPLLGLLAATATLAWAFWILRRAGRPPLGGAGRGLLAVACLAIVAFAALGWRHEATRSQAGGSLARGVHSLVDSSSRTARVRLTLWRHAAEAFTSAEPLVGAAGADRRHPLRPWIGHGPGLAGPPLARAGGAELARLEPRRVADQAHNQVWDLLLTGGLLAVAGWVLLHGALIEIFLAGLGLLRAPVDAAWMWGSLATGALAGLAAASCARLDAGLSVPLGVAGALLGVAAFALAPAIRARAIGSRRPQTHHPCATAPLAAIVAAAVTARLVAGQFGIETVSDALVLAVLAALLVPTALGATPRPPADRSPSVLPAAAAVLALALVWAFAFDRHGGMAVPAARQGSLAAVTWLVAASLILAASLAPHRGGWRVAPPAVALLAGAIAGHRLLGAYLGSRVAAGSLHWAEAVARHEIVLAAGFVVVLVGGGALYGALILAPPADVAPATPAPGPAGRRLPALVAVGIVASWAVCNACLRPLAAGFLQRAGERAREAGSASIALGLTAAATRHAGDPVPSATVAASIERDLGQAADSPAVRDRHFDRAAAALEGALRAAPFHSDLVGNLGLLDLERWRHAAGNRRLELADRAASRFAAALVLRPVGGPWARHLAAARRLAADSTPGPQSEP